MGVGKDAQSELAQVPNEIRNSDSGNVGDIDHSLLMKHLWPS